MYVYICLCIYIYIIIYIYNICYIYYISYIYTIFIYIKYLLHYLKIKNKKQNTYYSILSHRGECFQKSSPKLRLVTQNLIFSEDS